VRTQSKMSLAIAVAMAVAISLAVSGGTLSAGATSKASTAAAVAEAKRSLLRLSDFPNGWKSLGSNHPKTTTSTALTKGVAICEGISTTNLATKAPHATTPQFSQPKINDTVTEGVIVYPSSGWAARQFDVYANAMAPDCMTPYFQKAFGSTGSTGVTEGTASALHAPFPRYGSRTTATTVTIPFSSQGLKGDAYYELVVVQEGRSVAYIGLTSVGSPFPTSLAHRLTTEAAHHLA